MTMTITPRKPRNPLVAPSHFRRAGSHRPGGGALRQQSSRALRRELDQLARPKPSP
ncbi:hypothetical protein [Piscinibacter sp. XHJ-5]|uniref:hypothetical protein n=1 Tax=Piscinibacter sp. XHJ-5 TaxID=3037797 RepID=UPI002452B75B|nr:hypothetical protein [Piscinibacter sp. XHJ-5]